MSLFVMASACWFFSVFLFLIGAILLVFMDVLGWDVRKPLEGLSVFGTFIVVSGFVLICVILFSLCCSLFSFIGG